MSSTRKRLRGLTMCWRELQQLPQGVGTVLYAEMLWNVSAGPVCLSGTMKQTETHAGYLTPMWHTGLCWRRSQEVLHRTLTVGCTGNRSSWTNRNLFHWGIYNWYVLCSVSTKWWRKAHRIGIRHMHKWVFSIELCSNEQVCASIFHRSSIIYPL